MVALDVVVAPEFHGQRADQALARLLASHPQAPAVSRTEIQRWMRDGAVHLEGRAAQPKTKVAAGERFAIRAKRRQRRVDWRGASAVDLVVAYEDDDVIVIDKPAGLVVHPAAGHPDGTLVNGLLALRPALAALPRAGLVHRLDKDTSGLLMVAANAASQRALIDALAARRVERRYLGVAEGRLIADRKVDMPIGRHPRQRMRQAVRGDGQPALSHIAIRERFAAHTLVEARLHTGRTHQLRVHLAAIDHPLAGDKRYRARGVAPPGASAEAAAFVRGFPRQALHAWRLAFAQPLSGAPLAFESPLPEDIRALLAALAAP